MNNIRSKLSYNRFHHLADDGYEKYYKKGFSPSYNCLENNELYFVKTRNFNIDRLGKESEEYLRKTLEFCNNNEIDVSIIVMPLYELEVISYENYDNYHNLLKSVADEYDTPVYDFNYIRGDVFDTQNRSFYRNVDHLNTVGAEVFTPIMWSAVCASPEEKEEYFYSSYEEKREKEPLKVFGVYHEDSDDTLDRCTIACNRTNGAEFKISLVDEFGNIIESIQDYDDNRCFYLPKGEKCSVLIESRVKQEPIEACIIDVGI